MSARISCCPFHLFILVQSFALLFIASSFPLPLVFASRAGRYSLGFIFSFPCRVVLLFSCAPLLLLSLFMFLLTRVLIAAMTLGVVARSCREHSPTHAPTCWNMTRAYFRIRWCHAVECPEEVLGAIWPAGDILAPCLLPTTSWLLSSPMWYACCWLCVLVRPWDECVVCWTVLLIG